MPATDQLTSPSGLLAPVKAAVWVHSWFSSTVAAAMGAIATEPASSSRMPTSALGFAYRMGLPMELFHWVVMPMYSPPSMRVSSTELTVVVNSTLLIGSDSFGLNPTRTASSLSPVISA